MVFKGMPELAAAIKKGAADTVCAGAPVSVFVGTVRSVSPLSVYLDQKHIVDEPFLVVSRNVTNYNVNMKMEHFTEEDDFLETKHSHSLPAGSETFENSFDPSHKHEYKGEKTFLVLNALSVGEKVILIKEQGGQKYYILDRVG